MSRNPTIKRILKESAELASHPSPDFTAAPLDSDLYEWHFTLRGPPSPSPFATGTYHGRIILPPAYPLKPPSFRFLTPTGRFEVNREICLSISGHHEETWQPAWGIRTALVAIRSFMDSEARGQVGGMESSEEVRKRLAGGSRAWKCGVCQRSNEEILREVEEAVGEQGGEGKREGDVVPEELRLAYREDLGKKEEGGKGREGETEQQPASAISSPPPQPQPAPPSQARQRQPPSTQPPPRGQTQQQQRAPAQRQEARAVQPWIDKAIYSIIGALIFLIWRKFML